MGRNQNRDKPKKEKKKGGRHGGGGRMSAPDASAKKKDRMSKREMRRRSKQKREDQWREDLAKFSTQLAVFGLKIKEVKGDGNCLFRTIADQMEGDENKHLEYRKQIVRLSCRYLLDVDRLHHEEQGVL